MRAVVLLLVTVLAGCQADPQPVTWHDTDNPPHRLSDWGVVLADGKHFALNDGVVPYDLNTPLFSDYALKLRSVWMPAGQHATYNSDRELEFPVGTIISKTFHYEKAAASRSDATAVIRADRESRLGADGTLDLDDYVLVETRLLVRYEQGWAALPYIWNDTQDEAYLELAGGQRRIGLVGEEGITDIVYIVPDANQCGGCHMTDHTAKALRPIGPKAWQLNRPYAWWDNEASQLENWADAGLLQGYNGTAPAGASWSDPGGASLESRARAYLDANCAHCHNRAGAADTSALQLVVDAPLDRLYGICKPPVAVGRGSGDRPFDIFPGRPEQSILVYRMQHSDPAIAMPELGRSAIHVEGVNLVSDWIASLNGAC